MPISSITVGIDFTPPSAVALQQAMRLAEFSRAKLHAIHVIDTLVACELEEALSPFQKNIRDGLVKDAQAAWEPFVKNIPGADKIPLDVRVDNRVHGILASARDTGADMLVMGAYGARKPEVGVGTVATACVRHASIPVLLVRDNLTGPFKKIVACVDFSPTSLAALDHAARLAMQDSAALHILHVYEAPWHELHYRAPTPEAAPSFQMQYRNGLERRLREFVGSLGKEELDYLKPTYALFDYTGHKSGIVQYATEVGADLLVLGTRGRTTFMEMLMGTTAERVLGESRCSILAVKPASSA